MTKFDEIFAHVESISYLQNKQEVKQFFTLIQQHLGSRYLEIGARRGFSFFMFANALADTPTRFALAIDMPNAQWGDSQSMNFLISNARALEAMGISNEVMFSNSHHMKTLLEARNVMLQHFRFKHPNIEEMDLETLDEMAKFDVLFIDGDHSRSGVLADYRMYSRLVKRSGFVAFHDIAATPKSGNGQIETPYFWKELKAKVPANLVKEIVAEGSDLGIGVVKNTQTWL
jgi:predicted O-methyltransferase YrrM